MTELADPSLLSAARAGNRAAFEQLIAPMLKSLKAHCYRMAGSWHEAEDLVQDSLVRAWRGLPTFEGRSSMRTWLYTVTTRTCLDALERRRARTLPTALGPAASPSDSVGPAGGEIAWLEPFPGDPGDGSESPEASIDRRESVALAFLTVLQKLPPRQRAVLLLREVLGWQASEVAELLDTSVASVNSALQRARETLDRAEARPARPPPESKVKELLERYVRAWEGAQLDGLVALLRDDAVLSMPPMSAWFQGKEAIAAAIGAMVFTPDAAGRYRFVATVANALPALAMYRRDERGRYLADAVHLLELDGEKIATLTAFLDPRLVAELGLPTELQSASTSRLMS